MSECLKATCSFALVQQAEAIGVNFRRFQCGFRNADNCDNRCSHNHVWQPSFVAQRDGSLSTRCDAEAAASPERYSNLPYPVLPRRTPIPKPNAQMRKDPCGRSEVSMQYHKHPGLRLRCALCFDLEVATAPQCQALSLACDNNRVRSLSTRLGFLRICVNKSTRWCRWPDARTLDITR